MRRQINREGLGLIKRAEGCQLEAYVCPAGVLTIGYGSTGRHVKPGMVISQDQAEELLRSDLRRFEDAVAAHAPTANDNQFAAMVSFAFNVGEGAFEESTLLRRHRAGQYEMAALEFGKWTKGRVNGVLTVLPGLVKRRAAEAALYRKA